MVDDWVEHGAASRYALSPDEVDRAFATPRTDAEATAAAEFELGQHLHRAGDHAAAIPHWREAHRLVPDNWTYKRQAWNFEDPMRQGHTDAYDGSWYEDIKKTRRRELLPATHTLTPRLGARVEGRDALSPGVARPRGTPRRRRTPG